MTTLDELKDNIYRIKSAPTGAPHDIYIVADYQVIDTLVQIAEAAFEITDRSKPREHYRSSPSWDSSRFVGWKCQVCAHEAASEEEIDHRSNCRYKRIQDGKKELEK